MTQLGHRGLSIGHRVPHVTARGGPYLGVISTPSIFSSNLQMKFSV